MGWVGGSDPREGKGWSTDRGPVSGLPAPRTCLWPRHRLPPQPPARCPHSAREPVQSGRLSPDLFCWPNPARLLSWPWAPMKPQLAPKPPGRPRCSCSGAMRVCESGRHVAGTGEEGLGRGGSVPTLEGRGDSEKRTLRPWEVWGCRGLPHIPLGCGRTAVSPTRRWGQGRPRSGGVGWMLICRFS